MGNNFDEVTAAHDEDTPQHHDQTLTPQTAYDLFARRYDDWSWQNFWHQNEWPHIRQLVETAPAGSILDVGMGTGFYLKQLANPGRQVYGIDISFGMLDVAKHRLGNRVQLVQADAIRIPFQKNTFDIVLVTRVATHIRPLDLL